MKKFLSLILVFLFALSMFTIIATAEEPIPIEEDNEIIAEQQMPAEENEEELNATIEETPVDENLDGVQQVEEVEEVEPEVIVPKHRITITWLFDPNMNSGMEPPFEGTSVIGSISFELAERESYDIRPFLYEEVPGASYWQPGFINYNGIPCYPEFTIGYGGKGIDPVTGEAIDGLPFDYDPFNVFTMPGTDVDAYYVYAPYYEPPEIPEDTLDKIVIYVNRPTGDINPVKQEYHAYEILHVGKAPTVQEDVTTDWSIHNPDPDTDGFSYWIADSDPWFDVVNSMTDYFVLTETSTPGVYIVILNPDKPATEDTAKEIARILEENTEGKPEKLVTADTPSYDNDPGYYLIVSDINSNLILGTTNIAITEKAEYPRIDKTVEGEKKINSGIGEVVTFTITMHFPQGAKAESIITDNMTDGLTLIPESIVSSLDGTLTVGQNQNGDSINGFMYVISGDTLKAAAAGEGGLNVTIVYNAIVNERAQIGNGSSNINTARLDFSHWAQQSTAEVYVTSFTFLKYDGTVYNKEDTNKTSLAGAKFQLLDANKNPIALTIINNNTEYRLAIDTDDASVVVNEFITGNSVILIKGVEAGQTYYLHEVSAPAGYNAMAYDEQVIPLDNDSTYIEIENHSGTLLPSTGGIGTTIFYVIGGAFILVAIALIVIKRIKEDRSNFYDK